MNVLRNILLALILATGVQAQDTFFTLAKAPLAITKDVQTQNFTFTNTSDKPLTRIKVFSAHGYQRATIVIIEELGPHKSITCDISKNLVAGADYHQAAVSCARYSLPIKLDQF